MCRAHESSESTTDNISRRSILAVMAGLPVSYAVAPASATAAPLALASALTAAGTPAGLTSFSHAMHLHGSDSEGTGSWAEHLRIAKGFDIDYLWPSDHDWRAEMGSPRLLRAYDFAQGLNGPMTWVTTRTGTAPASTTVVPLSGTDATHGTHALSLVVGTGNASSAGAKIKNTFDYLEGNVRGRAVAGPVRIRSGQMRLTITLSRHNLPSGPDILKITYVFGDVPAKESRISESEWRVFRPLPVGTWTTFSVRPIHDIARLWPGVDAEDNSINGIAVAAYSPGTGASLLLPRVDLPRNTVGDPAMALHNALIHRLAAATPGLVVGNSLEYSWDNSSAHANGFFADRPAPLLPSTHPYARESNYLTKVSKAVHELGGISSLNHPAGVAETLRPPAEQAAIAISAAQRLVRNRVYLSDIVELGYTHRGGLGLDAFLLQLGCMVWRDGWFFTANAVSDNHGSTVEGWLSDPGITHVWANGTSLQAQLDALKAGKAYVTLLQRFSGSLWLSLNGRDMGSVQVNPSTTGSNELTLTAVGLPAGSTVTFYRGPVDYPGSTVSTTGLTIQRTVAAADFAAGPVTVWPSRSTSAYYFAVVRSSAGGIIGFTNPAWDLKSEHPLRPIPAARRVS